MLFAVRGPKAVREVKLCSPRNDATFGPRLQVELPKKNLHLVKTSRRTLWLAVLSGRA